MLHFSKVTLEVTELESPKLFRTVKQPQTPVDNFYTLHFIYVHAQANSATGSCSCTDTLTDCFCLHADIDECETDNNNCHENAQCTNTVGSFTCSCYLGYTGDGTECHTAVLVFAGVLMFIVVVVIIIGILCGSICVVYKLRKMDAETKMAAETRMDAEMKIDAETKVDAETKMEAKGLL